MGLGTAARIANPQAPCLACQLWRGLMALRGLAKVRSSMKRMFQFSVATLLAIVTACAFGAHWYAAKRRFEAAQLDLGRAAYGEGAVTTVEDVYDASVRLLRAEQAVPFSDGRNACKRHLRLMELEEKGHRDWHNDKTADKIHVWVEEAQRWLNEAS